MVPFHIADRTITFFARHRPWSVPVESTNFETVKQLLLKGPPAGVGDMPEFVDELIVLADTRAGILAASKDKLVIDEDNKLFYNGRELHNLWVDKIIKFKEEGLPFQPIFLALEDLMKNPTPEAIDRLPIFLERVQAGFLPDGRCTGYKGVRKDYMDQHTGTIRNMVGDMPAMERSQVDANPNRSCSTGLHIGAFDYVIDHNYSGSTDRLMFVAFWPRDVVAVPTDYQGKKMRVCSYEVLDEVDPAFFEEFKRKNGLYVQGYRASSESHDGGGVEDEDHSESEARTGAYWTAKVGDWVKLHDGRVLKVRELDLEDDHNRIRVSDGGMEEWIGEHELEAIVEEPAPAIQAYEGSYVRLEGAYLRDGWYEVQGIESGEDQPDDRRVEVLVDGDGLFIANKYVAEHADNLPAGAALVAA